MRVLFFGNFLYWFYHLFFSLILKTCIKTSKLLKINNNNMHYLILTWDFLIFCHNLLCDVSKHGSSIDATHYSKLRTQSEQLYFVHVSVLRVFSKSKFAHVVFAVPSMVATWGGRSSSICTRPRRQDDHIFWRILRLCLSLRETRWEIPIKAWAK